MLDMLRAFFGGENPARAKIKAGALVIDVRTQQEYRGGHVDGAKLVPVDELQRRLADVDGMVRGNKAHPIVVYCASGMRSGRAKSMLQKAGYTDVTNGGGVHALM